MEHVYAFVKSPRPWEQMVDSRPVQLMSRLNAGEKLNPEEYPRESIVKLLGWTFDFRPFLRLFLVKDKYYGWQEVYAPNKTMARKNWATPSHIIRIEEIKP